MSSTSASTSSVTTQTPIVTVTCHCTQSGNGNGGSNVTNQQSTTSSTTAAASTPRPPTPSPYSRNNSVVFIVQPLPSTEEQLSDRLAEAADRYRSSSINNNSTTSSNVNGSNNSSSSNSNPIQSGALYSSSSSNGKISVMHFSPSQQQPLIGPPPNYPQHASQSSVNSNTNSSVELSSNDPTERVTVQQIVVSASHAAVLLEDGRICRFPYNVCQDRVGSNGSGNVVAGSSNTIGSDTKSSNSSSAQLYMHHVARGPVLPPISSITNSAASGSGSGSSGSQPPGSRQLQTARRRLIRSARPRGSTASVIMGHRGHVIPAQFVPEELISQAQVVLQGKSRNVIIRELQRTNLDVNLAVNNLLSRDDEDFDDGDDAGEQMIQGEDLMSLLDSGFPNEPVIIDSDFAEEVFASYPMRVRGGAHIFSSRSGSSGAGGDGASANGSSADARRQDARNSISRLREDAFSFIDASFNGSNSGSNGTGGNKSRWYSYSEAVQKNGSNSRSQRDGGSNGAKSSSVPSNDTASTNVQFSAISFYEQQQEYWPSSGDNRRFVAIAALHTELIALTATGQLCQWRWQDPEPFRAQLSDGTVYYHPKVPSLGLLQEKVTLLAATCIRATVATESGKLATWIDESIAPIASKLEHAATSQLYDGYLSGNTTTTATPTSTSSAPKINALYVSSLMSCIQLSNGTLFWWGIPPFAHRKKLIEKVKSERGGTGKSSSGGSSNNGNKSGSGNKSSSTGSGGNASSSGGKSDAMGEIVQGSMVCMRNSPLYQNGSIAFTTVHGVPKVGQLVQSAWKITDTCPFRVLSNAEIAARQQSSSGAVHPLNTGSLRPSSSSTTNQVSASVSSKDSDKCEMPPPPSPASSASSEAGYAPSPKRAKTRNHSSSSSQPQHQTSSASSDAAKDGPISFGDQLTSTFGRIENWDLKDVIFIEDVRNTPIGRVLKVDGNYVAVKFNYNPDGQGQQSKQHSTNTSSGGQCDFNFDNYIADCRLLRKDDLMVISSSSGIFGLSSHQQQQPHQQQQQFSSQSYLSTCNSKVYDCLQRYPRKVHIPENLQLVSCTLTNIGLHAIAKVAGYRFSYIVINVVTGKIEQDLKISIDYETFFGKQDPLHTMRLPLSRIALYSSGETEATTVVLCRDGNGTLYPLAKDCTETIIREPLALNMGPLTTIGLGVFALPNSYSNSSGTENASSSSSSNTTTTKTHAAVLGLAFKPQLLMPAILQSDLDLVRERLELIEEYSQYYSPMITELCDGNRNILHIAVSACFPVTNKPHSSSNGSGSNNSGGGRDMSIMNLFEDLCCEASSMDTDEKPSLASLTYSSTGNQQSGNTSAANATGGDSNTITEPLLDPSEQKPIAHSILWSLLDSRSIAPYLYQLLCERDFKGYTPFMMAVAGRAYSAANQIFLIAQRLARSAQVNVATTHNYHQQLPNASLAADENYRLALMQMLYPPGSAPDHSPLYMLITNDTCSFTWTGEEHINQDIFECRTCGLVGSLCCCTECARVCHRGHDCKLKRTSPTAYCDCWEKCKCKALIAGCQPARYRLLKMLLTHTDLSLRPNSRGEHILLFLVQTVLRQISEQKQYRPSRLRTGGASSRGKVTNSSSTDSCTNEDGTTVPEHDLEPPKFARHALEKLLQDWETVKSLLLTGYRSMETNDKHCPPRQKPYLYEFYSGTAAQYSVEEENAYLGRQNGSALLEKFTQQLLRIGLDLTDRLVSTLLQACQTNYHHAQYISRRFVRAIARISVAICFDLNPTLYASMSPSSASGFISLMDRALGGTGTGSSSSFSTSSYYSSNHHSSHHHHSDRSSSSASSMAKKNLVLQMLAKCRRILLSFLPLAIDELAEMAEATISAVRTGHCRPTAPFMLSTQPSDVLATTDELFSVDPAIYGHQRDFIDARYGGSVSTAPELPSVPPPPADHFIADLNQFHHLNVHQHIANAQAMPAQPSQVNVAQVVPEDSMVVDPTSNENEPAESQDPVNNIDAAVDDEMVVQPAALDNGSLLDDAGSSGGSYPSSRRGADDGMVIIGEIDEQDEEDNSNVGVRIDSESDSESNPDDASYLSNADNASMAQRSVVTGATAGSDVGVSSLPYDDESVNSNGDDVDDDDDEGDDGDDHDDEEEEQSDASDTGETEPEADEYSFLDEDLNRRISNSGSGGTSGGGAGGVGSSSTSNTGTGASSRSGLPFAQWAFRTRDTSNTVSEVPFRRLSSLPGDNVITMNNTATALARVFAIIVRQLSDLLPLLRDPTELQNANFTYLNFTPEESTALQAKIESRLGNTWEWLAVAMDSTESQLRFGCALTNRRQNLVAASSGGASSSSGATISSSASVNASSMSINDPRTSSNTTSGSAGSNFRRVRNTFSNHDDMLLLPSSLSRATSALRRISGLSLNRSGTGSTGGTSSNHVSANGVGGSGAGSSGTSGNAGHSGLHGSLSDSTSSRRDFLQYALSLMRAHSNDHFDSLPVLDVASLKHLAYVFDALIYYIRRGIVLPSGDSSTAAGASDQNGVGINFEQVIMLEYDAEREVSRNDRFFRRSNSTLFLGCPAPDPFKAPLSEALPLADRPHMLQPNARREQLFGVPRPSTTEEAKEMIEKCLPSQMGISKASSPFLRHIVNPNSSHDQQQEQPQQSPAPQQTPVFIKQEPEWSPHSSSASSPNSASNLSNGSSKQSSGIMACGGGCTTKPKTEPIDTKDNMVPFKSNLPRKLPFFGNQEKHDFLLNRWRLSLELFGRTFIEDVGLEPHSIMNELSGFPVKESRFRREMERLRTPSSSSMSGTRLDSRDISLLKLDRERCALITQTFKELNSVFGTGLHSAGVSSRRSAGAQHNIITRVKVTFKDEPGEGSGVVRSFYTAFAEAILAPEKLPSPDWLSNNPSSTTTGSSARTSGWSSSSISGGTSNGANAMPLSSTSNANGSNSISSPVTTSSGANQNYSSSYLIRIANSGSHSLVLSSGGSGSTRTTSNSNGSNNTAAEFQSLTAAVDELLRRPRSPSSSRHLRFSVSSTARRAASIGERIRSSLANVASNNSSTVASSSTSSSTVASVSNSTIGSGTNTTSALGANISSSVSGSSSVAPQRSPTLSGPTMRIRMLNTNTPGPLLRREARPFVPGREYSSPLPESKVVLGQRLHQRIYSFFPNLAHRLTGMFIEIPLSELLPLLASNDDEFQYMLSQAVEFIASNDSAQSGTSSSSTSSYRRAVEELLYNSTSGSSSSGNVASGNRSSDYSTVESWASAMDSTSALSVDRQLDNLMSNSNSPITTTPAPTTTITATQELDNEPLFYQPGPRGFYSPRLGRGTPARLNAFRNVGRIIGICFVQNELCPITFNRHVIKGILNQPVSWHDLAFFDPHLYESFRQLILDAESPIGMQDGWIASMDLRFNIDLSAEETGIPGGREAELLPNGQNIEVTPSNIFQYVRQYALYRMVVSQLQAIQAIRHGIFDVLPPKSLDGLTAEDFRLLLNGVNEINVQLLQSYVSFIDESGDGSEHLSYFRRWFWWVVERMTNEEKQDLIYFWTGSPALPASEEGFQPLPSITIRPRDDLYFVTANTCISRLYIPLYSSRNILRQKLLASIKAKSFGFI